jgi:S1-C subfamily serine protease
VERSEWPEDDAHEADAHDAGEHDAGEPDAAEPDTNAYPPAPLPPHERAWRHPSELGGATWAHTEPPLAIGRGLLITTGAIGGLLSLAVLWAMLPSAGRGSVASPTVVTSTANSAPGSVITARPDTLVATSLEARVPSTSVRSGPVTTAVPADSTTTTLENPETTVDTQQAAQLEFAPVAVSISDSLVITTARAIPAGSTLITVTGADGQPHDATVLMVDRELGLAVLSAGASATASYGIGPAAAAGDVVTVLGALPTSANVGVDAAGHLTLDAWADSMAEGTPVINADGLLVGMCSHGSSGPELVSVANVAAMLHPPKSAKTGPWLGVHVVEGEHGTPLIDRVDANGPAAAAGISGGDAIAAVDGVTVSGVDQLKLALATYVPTDTITLTIVHADQTSTDIQVTLGTTPSM